MRHLRVLVDQHRVLFGSQLTGDDGEIGSFRVKLAGRYGTTLTPTKTVLSATINNKVENVVSDVTGGYVGISSPTISTNDNLDFGAVSVTETCEQPFTISNYGSAPLTISRIVFNNENLSVTESLPLVIQSRESQDVTVVYSSVEQTAFEATMLLYSNDPGLRLREVTVTGSRFAPNYVSITANDVYSDDNLQIEVSTDNYDPMTGLQFDLTYPGTYFEPFDNNYTVTDRATDMTVTMRQIDSNTLRCFCYFLTGGSVAAGNGKVMTIELKPKGETVPEGIYDVSLTNIKFGTSEMDNKYAGDETLQSTFEVKSILPGDVNGDGDVNEVDAQLILDVSVGNISLNDLAVPKAINVPGGNAEALEVNAQLVLDYSVATVKPW